MTLMNLSWRWRIMAGLVACAIVAFIGVEIFAVRTLSYAERMVDDREWLHARDALRTYLSLKPHDDVARMMMAQSLINDNSRPIVDVAQEALAILSKIGPGSSESINARISEARVYLLLLLQPGHAEDRLLESLRREPDRTDAHALLWKLYDLTNRWFLIEPHFWSVYEHTEASKRSYVLRDWYMTEFAPASAVADLERQMGILGPDEQPDAQTEIRRYEAFLTNESDRPVNYACAARWYQAQAIRTPIARYLQLGESLPSGLTDPFLIATHVTFSLESGDFAEAEVAFRRWPDSDRGYEYYKTRGIIEDQVLHQDQAARVSYEHALEFSVGHSDWHTCHRLSNVLMRLGEPEAAAKARRRSKETELQMETEVHQPLRLALLQPNSPKTIQMMAEFYNHLGRSKESEAWNGLLPTNASSADQTP